jgi:hypothetical protein
MLLLCSACLVACLPALLPACLPVCLLACLPECVCLCVSLLWLQHGGLSRKERMMRQLGLKEQTAEELAQEVQQLQDDWEDDD